MRNDKIGVSPGGDRRWGRAKGTLLLTPVFWIICDDRCHETSRSSYPDDPERIGG
jgi:hypothetical protein